jgi:nucleoside 2-deoxyribosyltransferase
MEHKMDHKREPHEGAWMYVSLPQGERLQVGVRETCRRHGWPVVSANDELADRRLQALRLADACIVDISCASPDVGAELAFALCEGRPVIALRSEEGRSAPFVEEITREHPSVRQLSYEDVDGCLAALDSVLGDLVWQEQVAWAAPGG